MEIIINLILIILNILESYNDFYVIESSNPNDTINNRKWHQYGGAFAFLLAIFFSCYINKYVGILYLTYRSMIFPIALNLLRGKSWYYLSANGFDGFIQKIFNNKIWFISMLVFTIFLNCLYLKVF